MAERMARELDGELDGVLVHRIPAPHSPEYSIGSVGEDGMLYVEPSAPDLGGNAEYIDREVAAKREVLRYRRARISPIRPQIEPAGRIVIVVDDGVVSGSTVIGALKMLRARKPLRLIAALGVAPKGTAERIRAYADEVAILEEPDEVRSLGDFFDEFPQVQDDEVAAILHRVVRR
jgi:predicted phosphoribosyltransferase